MAFLRKRRDDPKVDLTPMVDVVFLLLIFFMISTTFVESPGIDIDLPESGSRMEEAPPEELKVYLSSRGDIFLEDQPISMEKLRERLSEIGKNAPKTTFLLLADREARHGEVVRLMDVAREAGFGKLAIATENIEKKQ